MCTPAQIMQELSDWLDENINQNPSLAQMSRQTGYSTAYCSILFRQLTGKTLRGYMADLRLRRAAFLLRDTDMPLIEVAMNCGYSSQSVFTRAFVTAFSLSPGGYRQNPVPIPLPIKRNPWLPDHMDNKGELKMAQKTTLMAPSVRVEYIPAHDFIGVWDPDVNAYFPFFNQNDCEKITGTVDSISNLAHPVLFAHTAGWYKGNGDNGYFYGLGVECDSDVPLPNGFQRVQVPGSYYLAFSHPAFDFQRDCEEVMTRVNEMANSFDPKSLGFVWDEEMPHIYQTQLPETLGYIERYPVKTAK